MLATSPPGSWDGIVVFSIRDCIWETRGSAFGEALPPQTMALEKAGIQPSSSWFLTARGGDLRLRLQTEIRIGEDDSGDLTFDADQALVACSVAAGRLKIICLSSAYRLSREDGSRLAEVDLPPGQGIRLELPRNRIVLRDHAARAGDGFLALRVIPADAAIPIKAPRRSKSDSPPSRKDPATQAGAPIPILSLTQRLDDDLPDLTAPILLKEALPETSPVSHERRAEQLLSRPVRVSGGSAVALLLLCLFAPALITSDDAAIKAGINTPAPAAVPAFEAPHLELLASRSELVARTEAAAPPRIQPRLVQLPNEQDDATAQGAELRPAAGDGRAAADSIAGNPNAAELLRARELLASGAIIAPVEDNAVKLLRRILNDNPADADARQLLAQCAEQLLTEADQALSTGEVYQARNLVEEVRAFYPDHRRADQLWRTLTAPASNQLADG